MIKIKMLFNKYQCEENYVAMNYKNTNIIMIMQPSGKNVQGQDFKHGDIYHVALSHKITY